MITLKQAKTRLEVYRKRERDLRCELAEALRLVAKWIPVGERLPENKDRRVLTWDGHAHSLTAPSHWSHWMQVTHWCEIPDGPGT